MTEQFTKRSLVSSIDELNAWRDRLLAERKREAELGVNELRICTGAGCIASGSLRTREEIEGQLRDRGLADRWRVVGTGCMGPCFGGPVIMVGDVVYERVRPEDAAAIVVEHLGQGRVVERLTHRRPDGRHVARLEEIDFFKRQVKIVLRNCGVIDPMRIEHYIERDGYQALAQVLSRKDPDSVIDALRESGLRGRGGAGFPTWRKWTFARQQTDAIKFVVCNADEGDPGAFMDRSVLEGDPHSVIEGMAIAAATIGAQKGFIYVRAEYPLAVERLRIALDQAREVGLLGQNILNLGFDFDIEIRMGSGAFVWRRNGIDDVY